MHTFYADLPSDNSYINATNFYRPTDLTFSINNSYIFTSKKKGTINMSYKAIPVGEEGLPMIPDDHVFFKALRLFIEKEHCRILYLNDKLAGDKFNKIEQDYYWAVGQ